MLLAVLLGPRPTSARTWYVHAGGWGDAPTIQAAIDSSSTGDTILVGTGVYEENLRIDHAIVLTSKWGPPTTILDGRLLDRVITVLSSVEPGLEISGFTIKNGRTYGNGGGISLTTYGAVIVDNVIENNSAVRPNTSLGGGLYVKGNASVARNIVRQNSAGGTGGGIYVYGLGEYLENTIIGNVAGIGGGGIDGGGRVEGNLIAYNSAGVFAGGAMAYGTFRNNTVVENTSSDGSIAGVRIYAAGLVANNLVANNGSPTDGSGTIGMGCRLPEGMGSYVRCNDVWGHDVNAIIGCALTDNISINPIFCDRVSFEISTHSPCAPEASACGLMGARAPNCSTTSVQPSTWGTVKRLYR